MTGIHCRVSHDPMTDTTLSLTATSVPIIVHPDIDKYIHSFLPKLVECRHCVGSQMLRKVNSWAVPKEYMDSVPKHVYYLAHPETMLVLQGSIFVLISFQGCRPQFQKVYEHCQSRHRHVSWM